MNIIFFGSSKYSTIVEKALLEKLSLSLVVTIPDKPIGRKQTLTPSPVKEFAIENKSLSFPQRRESRKHQENVDPRFPPKGTGFPEAAHGDDKTGYIPVITTDKLNKNIIDQIAKYNPDFIVVADYSLILPKELLDLPKVAPLNVHHSLLPKYRGPSPAQTAILNGDKISGVTVIKMSEKMDAGDILAQKEYELKKDETTDSLYTKLNEMGAKLVIDVIENFEQIKPVPQDESKATYTKKIKKEDGFFDINNPPSPEILDRMTRAYFPWPNVYIKLKIRDQELRIKFLPEQKIQVEGKRPMNIKDFINGYPETREKILQILKF